MGKIKFLIFLFCSVQCKSHSPAPPALEGEVRVGAQQLELVLPHLKDKHVALVVNHTSLIGKTHLADSLVSLGVSIKKIFAPEHGFRGDAADGEQVKDGIDKKTGIPLLSLYGKDKKPTPQQLADVDVVIFDIQDVGTRFYTYISTMHLVMEACAENGKTLMILDRPNPNGYVDGPILQPEQKSFVGMHPIPIVHGLTVAELAQMINGEGWLGDTLKCKLIIIPIKNWKHDDAYSLPVRPSPNLPNDQAIKLYPSLCLFEGTVISVGRGTTMQFQILGNPELKGMNFEFTPMSMKGISVNPPHQDKICYGIDLRSVEVKPRLNLSYLFELYKAYPENEKFFIPYFDKLAGNSVLKDQIRQGYTEEQIRASWEPELSQYKEMRKKYLLYQ
jgi:uncharacterized protein YbbC (DUF1343 family)